MINAWTFTTNALFVMYCFIRMNLKKFWSDDKLLNAQKQDKGVCFEFQYFHQIIA